MFADFKTCMPPCNTLISCLLEVGGTVPSLGYIVQFAVPEATVELTRPRSSCVHACMYVCIYAWMDGWMDGWMDVNMYIRCCVRLRWSQKSGAALTVVRL